MLVFECSCYRKVTASTFVEPALIPYMSQFYYITPLSTEYSMTNGKINNAYYIQYSNTTTFSGFPPPKSLVFWSYHWIMISCDLPFHASLPPLYASFKPPQIDWRRLKKHSPGSAMRTTRDNTRKSITNFILQNKNISRPITL